MLRKKGESVSYLDTFKKSEFEKVSLTGFLKFEENKRLTTPHDDEKPFQRRGKKRRKKGKKKKKVKKEEKDEGTCANICIKNLFRLQFHHYFDEFR